MTYYTDSQIDLMIYQTQIDAKRETCAEFLELLPMVLNYADIPHKDYDWDYIISTMAKKCNCDVHTDTNTEIKKIRKNLNKLFRFGIKISQKWLLDQLSSDLNNYQYLDILLKYTSPICFKDGDGNIYDLYVATRNKKNLLAEKFGIDRTNEIIDLLYEFVTSH